MSSQPFSLRIPDEINADLEFISSITKRSQASVALEAIGNDVSVRAKRMRMIEEAKEEAKKGDYISHEAVGRWVESLGTENELPRPKPDVFKPL